MLSSWSPLSLLSRLGQCEERAYNLWNLPYFIFDFWDWAMCFCFWTRTVSFDPILSYFQESASDWICKVHCMLYTGTFYTGFIRRFSTSPAKNCFVNFFYCRYVRGLDFSRLEWDAMTFWIALRCIDCTTYWTKTPYWPLIERGCENPTWYSAERSVTLHSFDFTKYRLWTSLFRRGTIVNGQIVVCSFDLTEYHL